MMRPPLFAAVLAGSLPFLSLLTSEKAHANPVVPEAGSATQVTQSGSEFTITGGLAAGDGQALFHSFEQLGLTAGQTATFLASPDVQSILGRVTGGNASYIDGLLRVSGSPADLYLINPAGILFGANAQLDLAGSFAATTASGVQFADGVFDAIAAADWSQLTGAPTGFVFAVDGAGAIVNGADLTVAPGEAIMLVGGQVINTGTLTAPDGDITIAAMPDANLVRISHPDMVLNLELAALPADTEATTTFTPLTLPALLTGGDANFATGLAVQPDGTVALVNTDVAAIPGPGTAIAAGQLNAAGAIGGDVAVVGDRVALLAATIDVSGRNGAGTARIGGDYQGIDTLPGSQLTYVDAATSIVADGGTTGSGGRVILWSDGATAFYGNISAAGGSDAGDGGFVEVSGQQTLVYRGTVTAIAPQGDTGTLLLDPTNVTIRNGSADGDDSDGSAFQLTEFTFAAIDAIPTIIYESELESSPGNINIGIRASNNIVLENLADDALTFFTDPMNPGSITLEAGNEVRFEDGGDAIVAPNRAIIINAPRIAVGTLDTSDSGGVGGNVALTATGRVTTADVITQGNSAGDRSGDIIIIGSDIQTGRLDAGGGFSDSSRVVLTATSGDVVVDTITAGGNGLEINAARRFQARDTFDAGVRITLNSATDAALIDFLMKGDPQPLIDAGLVDTAEQILFSIPASISVSPDAGGGAIMIRHGGSSANDFSDGNITIEGSDAFANIQFVSGPNDDHTIAIDPMIPNAEFMGFTPLFPAGTFPEDASGTTGAILRGQGDATLVTSFQNQPFVPVVTNPEVNPPDPSPPTSGGSTAPITPDTGAPTTGETGNPDSAIATNTELENLTDDGDTDAIAAPSAPSADLDATDVNEDCQSQVTNRTADEVTIVSTCPAAATVPEND